MINVLVVEDDFFIGELLQTALEADGYCVTGVAHTVEEALDAVGHDKPDFAVIDVHLAKGELGTDLGVRLREMGDVGILFSTGNDNNPNLTLLAGDAVMRKPYRLAEVGRSLKILGEMAQYGQTQIAFPRSFRLLTSANA